MERTSKEKPNMGDNSMHENREQLCESFNHLLWHDSKLRGIHLQHRGDVDDMILDTEMRGLSERELTPATVILEDVAFIICDLDVQGKRGCGDDISDGSCRAESELKTKIQEERLKYSPGALDTYFHFQFYLIPPGGMLDVIAAGFNLFPKRDGPGGS
jgi:hypothetical protein